MKNFYLTITCLSAAFMGSSQNLQQSWRDTLALPQGVRAAELNDAVLDNNGNLYVCGLSTGSRGADFYVAKYNPNGIILWEDLIDVNPLENSTALKLSLDATGNLYVIGYNGQTFGPHQALIVKYSAAGTILWQTTYASPVGTGALFTDLKISSGNLFLTGTRSGSSHQLALAARYNTTTGAAIWTSTFDGGNECEFTALDTDANGNLIGCGSSNSGSAYLLV